MIDIKEKPKEFFYQLESLRGIAAILVIAFHCVYFFEPFKHVMLFNKGYVMVDMFFVLSGFVIYNNYANAINTYHQFKNFLFLRIGRVYPLHFFTTIIWLFAPILEYLTGDYGLKKSSFSLLNTISNFLLIHNWGFKDFYALNAPSWSISTELFAYIYFAFFLFLLKKYFKIMLFLTLLLAGIWVAVLDKDNLFIPLSRCLYSFAIGCFVSILYKKISIAQLSKIIPKPWILLLTTIILLEYFFRNWDLKEYILFPLASALLILSLLVFPRSNIVKFLERPFLIRLGTLSYSMYMVHGIAITLFVRIFKKLRIDLDNLWGSLFLILFIFVGTYVLSKITYKYIEKMYRDRVRRWISNSQR